MIALDISSDSDAISRRTTVNGARGSRVIVGTVSVIHRSIPRVLSMERAPVLVQRQRRAAHVKGRGRTG